MFLVVRTSRAHIASLSATQAAGVRGPCRTRLAREDKTLAPRPTAASPEMAGAVARESGPECADRGPGSGAAGPGGKGRFWRVSRALRPAQGQGLEPAAWTGLSSRLPSCVTLGKGGNLSELRFPPL